MSKPKLLVFMLILSTNALPFFWHKRFLRSITNVCLSYCALSIPAEKCIWGNCVDNLRKECITFFQQIQQEPLRTLGAGLFHTVYEIGGTNLVSKGLDLDSDADYKFVTKIIHRLPKIEGINRPLCMTTNGNQYKVISEKVIPFDNEEMIFRTIPLGVIINVFHALDTWVKANGMDVFDWKVLSIYRGFGRHNFIGHNIALTYAGMPTFLDFDVARFKDDDMMIITVEDDGMILIENRDPFAEFRNSKDEEKLNDAREKLEILTTRNPQWKQFTNEVAKRNGLPPFHNLCRELQKINLSFCMNCFWSMTQLLTFFLLFFRLHD